MLDPANKVKRLFESMSRENHTHHKALMKAYAAVIKVYEQQTKQLIAQASKHNTVSIA